MHSKKIFNILVVVLLLLTTTTALIGIHFRSLTNAKLVSNTVSNSENNDIDGNVSDNIDIIQPIDIDMFERFEFAATDPSDCITSPVTYYIEDTEEKGRSVHIAYENSPRTPEQLSYFQQAIAFISATDSITNFSLNNENTLMTFNTHCNNTASLTPISEISFIPGGSSLSRNFAYIDNSTSEVSDFYIAIHMYTIPASALNDIAILKQSIPLSELYSSDNFASCITNTQSYDNNCLVQVIQNDKNKLDAIRSRMESLAESMGL